MTRTIHVTVQVAVEVDTATNKAALVEAMNAVHVEGGEVFDTQATVFEVYPKPVRRVRKGRGSY